MALNDVIYNKKVDVAQAMPVPVVFAKQNDNAKRKVVVMLVKNGQPFVLGTGVNGYIQGATAPNPVTKRQVKFKRDLTAIDTTQGTATFIITESMTAEIGITQCEVSIYDTEKPQEILCTANINIEVQGTGMSKEDEMASDDYKAITTILAEVTTMRNEVNTKTTQAIAAQGAAETAAQNAYNSALGVQKIVAGNEAYTKQEADLKYSVAPRKEAKSTTGELKLTDADDGLSYIELEGNSEQYANTANKNLIDLHFVTDGYSINSTGTLDKGEQYFTTGYIVVEPGEQYTFTRAVSIANRQGCFYDKDKVFLQPWTGDAGISKNTVTVPENAKYLRLFDYISHKQESQLEKGNVATDYVIGAVDTPSPDYPSEVKSVGDIPKDVNGVEIRNLLDEEALKNPDNWSIQGDSVYYVKLSPSTAKLLGTAYKMLDVRPDWKSSLYLSETTLAGANARIILINNSGVAGTGSYTFPSIDPIYLVGYNRNNDVMTKAQFIDEIFRCYKFMATSASEIDEYRPYIGENNGLVKLESTGKNLFPGKGVVIGNIGAGGIPGSITKVLRTDFIKIDNNKQYVFNPGTYVPYVYLYGSNKEYIKGLSGIPKFNSENADYVILQFNSKPEAEQTQNDVDKMNKTLQLEEGTQSTEYQPYHQQIIWIPLREPLRGLPDGRADTIDRDGNVIQYIDCSGVEQYSIAQESAQIFEGNLFKTSFKNGNYVGIAKKDNGVYCNIMKFKQTASLQYGVSASPLYGVIYFNLKGKLSENTVDLARKFLNDNNAVFYFTLGTPITYQIPAIYIETYEPVTNVRCLNKVKPSTMGLDYKLAISSLIKRLEALETTAVQEVTRNV